MDFKNSSCAKIRALRVATEAQNLKTRGCVEIGALHVATYAQNSKKNKSEYSQRKLQRNSVDTAYSCLLTPRLHLRDAVHYCLGFSNNAIEDTAEILRARDSIGF